MSTNELVEPAQYAAVRQHRLPRRELGRGVTALLLLLRVYVMIAVPVVGYAFVHALMTSP
ncbi:MAG TPA: hypothetical protein VFN46_06340 [Acetobacteraceae bacterium]|nr:hypothetical protein [Acetobacteraceae bacterium]